MFKATVLSSNLRGGISFANHAISSRSQLPILLNFLLSAKDGNLFISATDLEIGIIIKIPAKIVEEGEVSISAKTFVDLVSNIDQEKLTLELKENVLILQADKLKTSFPTLLAQEFPKLYETKGEKQAEFKKEELEKEIQKIVFASAGDMGRPALSGVLIRKNSNGEIVVVATDGYRLSLKQGLSEKLKAGESMDLLVPARVIKELAGLKSEDENITLYVVKEGNQVLFECGDATVIGRLIEAEYPDYQKIIPDEPTAKAVFDKGQAHQAVRACSVFAREAANIVKMNIGNGKVVFSASASSVGENEVEIEAKTTGEENEIAFNARYLLEFFSAIDGEEVSFEMTGPLNPGVFRVAGDSSYLHLIMPIRITD